MKFGVAIKEKLARIIADYFTTSEIANIFADAGVSVDKSLYAKWRITLDAFGKLSSPEQAIPRVLEVFSHPLNFPDLDIRKKFVREMNKVLAYAKLEINATDSGAQVLDEHGFPASMPDFEPPDYHTPAEYVRDVINFFKDEYNKVRIAGLTYEYAIGEVANTDGWVSDRYAGRKKAVEQLKRIDFITELVYEVQHSDDGDAYDYAMCKIDESKLTQKEEPVATAASAEAIAQRVIHEHTHRFENSENSSPFKINHHAASCEVWRSSTLLKQR